MTKTLTHKRLTEVMDYNPDDGLFRWAVVRKKCTKGTVAGSTRADGYVTIRIDYKRYYAHRLAWFYMTKEWPQKIVDHKDMNPTNNKFENLRLATPTQSVQNRGVQRNNLSSLKGVKRTKDGKFYAMINVDKKARYLGSFDDKELAHDAYVRAAKKHFGEFARAN